MKEKFISIGKNGSLINVDYITAITSLHGHSNFLRYEILLSGGQEISVFEKPESGMDNMPREELIHKLFQIYMKRSI